MVLWNYRNSIGFRSLEIDRGLKFKKSKGFVHTLLFRLFGQLFWYLLLGYNLTVAEAIIMMVSQH
jgi:hypothetical protein